MTELTVFLIIWLAIFTQSFSGFGLALVSMPLLIGVVGLGVATPLVALVGLTAEGIILARYRQALNLRAVALFTAASVVGIPLGVLALRQVSKVIILPVLGIVVAGYAVYALLNLRLPRLDGWQWSVGLGVIAGALGGAYNVPGPPVILYGTARRWPPDEFKSNLQGFFLFNSLLVTAAHAVGGNYTPDVLRAYLVALPAIALGALTGFALAARVDAEHFRQIALVLLIGLGISLIV
ncbi:MAG: sulfite exporter TauE/SafE family protein [Anaerolineae bacterium]|nr:sulfite exporter TauE/SafE family protein [Anaerolineae bacterium]